MSEGRLMKLASASLSITATPHTYPANTHASHTPNGHQSVISNGTHAAHNNNHHHHHPLQHLQHHHHHHSTSTASITSNASNATTNHDSTPTTPTPSLKLERPTPTATPTSVLSMTPTPINTPLMPPSNFTAIMEPVQNMPLDLHIGESCDGSESDPNVSLDYVLNSNGSTTCRLCGELLPSRNHWYRHKYKTHPSALYRCDECGVVYKSKRGYETHMEVKHAKVKSAPSERPRRREWEGVNRVMEEAKRQQEEAMVKAIIARVKIECAMEGEDCSRRGYQKH